MACVRIVPAGEKLNADVSYLFRKKKKKRYLSVSNILECHYVLSLNIQLDHTSFYFKNLYIIVFIKGNLYNYYFQAADQ